MTRFLYDTAVFAYAIGGEHPYREPCRRILALAAADELRGEASADLVQELMHYRHRRTGDRVRAAREAREAAAVCVLHEVRPDDVLRATRLYERTERLGARDAVLAALALERDIPVILSPDRAFDEVPGLERVDPADEAAVERLREPAS